MCYQYYTKIRCQLDAKKSFLVADRLFFGNKIPVLRFVHDGQFYFYTLLKRNDEFDVVYLVC